MTGDKSKQIQPSDIEDGPLKRTLSREPGLRRLVVFRNQLSGPIPSEIGLLHRTLETAELAYNEFSSSMPTELGRLTNVEKLFLEKNFLTGLIVSEIGQMANLTFMDVSDNALSGPRKFIAPTFYCQGSLPGSMRWCILTFVIYYT